VPKRRICSIRVITAATRKIGFQSIGNTRNRKQLAARPGAFRRNEPPGMRKILSQSENRQVPQWNTIPAADSDSGEHRPMRSRTHSPGAFSRKVRYECLMWKRAASAPEAMLRRKSAAPVIPNAVPRFFFPAAFWRARDAV